MAQKLDVSFLYMYVCFNKPFLNFEFEFWIDYNFTASAQDMNSQNELENYTLTISATSPKGKWVNYLGHGNVYISQWTGPPLVKIKNCRLSDITLKPGLILAYKRNS